MFFGSKLKGIKNLKHCFISRKNGFSKGFYKSLNCGPGSLDKKENVLKNIEFVTKKIGCKKESLITLNQMHTSNAVICDNNTKNKHTADAIVTKNKNLSIGVLTADCVPILFYDPNKKIIGCAHSGWKGALKGIVSNTVKKFNELSSSNSDLIAVVGPCINQSNYEVKSDFFKKFIDQNKKNKIFFKKINDINYNFNLRGFVNKELINLGIKKIENIDIDTFSNKELFFSYRRSMKNKEEDYGRCISVILMT